MLNLSTLSEVGFKLPLISLQELAAFIVLALFCVFTSLELLSPRDSVPPKQARRSYKTNVLLFILNGVAMSVLSITSLFVLAGHCAGQGLLALIPNVFWQACLSLLLLDLLLYFWHQACHQFDWLWMFHRVHHNDLCLNSSTAFRVHFLEVLTTTLVKAIYVIVLGISPPLLLVNEIILTGCILFHHSNIRIAGERLLGRLLIVPYLHQAHHSTERYEHDRNYGALFSLWDRVFGTLIEAKPALIGIKGQSPQTLLGLLKFGFTPLPAPALVVTALPVNLKAMIAEAAYYKAERRNFNPGDELCDWLEAKAEIVKRFCGDSQGCNHLVDGI
jgi:sterol desaturase/sphingolipid hydroxylase (fatty acid hydroxylase superfamily)